MLVLTTKTMMTTMGMRTNSRTKKLVKLLEMFIAQEYLYTDEQIKDMKKQLNVFDKFYKKVNNIKSKYD